MEAFKTFCAIIIFVFLMFENISFYYFGYEDKTPLRHVFILCVPIIILEISETFLLF